MGDEILKTLCNALLVVLALSQCTTAKEEFSLGSDDMKAYDKIFEKIAEKRLGVDTSLIDKIENPFILNLNLSNLEGEGNVSQEVVFTLEATFDQKAKINGLWYKKNDDVSGFKLTKVDYDRVVLQNEIDKKELFIRTKDDSNFKISYK